MATKFYDVNFESKRVYLGDVGYFDENNYRAIRIDVSSVLSDYPSASFKVLMQRAGENHPYEKPAGEVTMTDNKLTAELTETDMNKQGMLKVQVVFEWGSVTGRSNTFIAHVGDSLSSDAGDPQSPYADALQKIDEFLETGGGAISPEMIEEAVGNYLTENPIEETDPTVPSWAKAASKPTYTAAEVGALPSNTKIPSALSEMTADSTHRTVTDAEKEAWNAKSNFSGSYNDLTNKPTIPAAYSLPIATPSVLGGVKPISKTDEMTQGVGVDSEGKLWALPGGGSGGDSGGEATWNIISEGVIGESVSSIIIDSTADGAQLSTANAKELLIFGKLRMTGDTKLRFEAGGLWTGLNYFETTNKLGAWAAAFMVHQRMCENYKVVTQVICHNETKALFSDYGASYPSLHLFEIHASDTNVQFDGQYTEIYAYYR